MSQAITVLRTLGPTLAKRWQSDGTIGDYDRAKRFRVAQSWATGVEGLEALLRAAHDQPQICIIRGQPRASIDLSEPITRDLENFQDAPSHLFLVDVDGFAMEHGESDAAAMRRLVASLPECFRATTYVWQLSGSHGHPSKVGQLRCHLWFWLAEPLTCEQAEAWTAAWLPVADKTVHRVVQVNYTSSPILEAGQTDPCAVRMGLERGVLDMLAIPEAMPVPASGEARIVRAKRLEMTDPREKAGIVGAVCRAFEPDEITILWPDLFAEGSTAERITWLMGGGSSDGIRVADNGTHLFNSHSTAPISRACNLFDFMRLHAFGHLDAGIDSDVLDLDITAAPSFRAMDEWARSQPEVQAQLVGPEAEAARAQSAKRRAQDAIATQPMAEQRMEEVLKLINEAMSLRHLERELGAHISMDNSFTSAERDVFAQAMKRRAAILHPGGVQLATIRKWLQPTPLLCALPDIGPDGPLATKGNVAALCALLGITLRYNVIAKSHEIIVPGLDTTFDNRDGATLAHVVSECARVGIPHGTALIKSYVCALSDQNPYNPVMTWIESRPWDGIDRLQQLYGSVIERPGFSGDVKRAILRRWLVQAVAAAASEVPVQLRGVLTIAGDQNIGKGRWVMSLAPTGLVRTGHTLRTDSKDSIKTAISYWITELGELDATFRKSDVAALKSFLSQECDTLRLPYAYADSSFQRRTVFYASVNEEEFLADTTGNTRYWVIPAQGMNFEHGIDMQQLWAQVHQIWKRGERHWMDEEEMRLVTTTNTDFEVVDPLHDRIVDLFDWSAGDDECTTRWMSATDIALALQIEHPNPGEVSRIGRIVAKLNGKQRRKSACGKKRLLAVPVKHGRELEFQ